MTDRLDDFEVRRLGRMHVQVIYPGGTVTAFTDGTVGISGDDPQEDLAPAAAVVLAIKEAEALA